MKRRFLSLILVLCLLVGLFCIPAAAKSPTTVEQLADTLYKAGLFRGTGTAQNGAPIYELSGSATRAQAVTMLVRILGKEEEAKQNKDSYETPFTDVPGWAKAYVGYAYENKLTNGTSATTFSPDAPVTTNQYLTFCLRALGYSSKTDFSYADPYVFAAGAGFLTAAELGAKKTFTRADMVLLSGDALLCICKGENQTLGKKLGLSASVLTEADSHLDAYSGTVKEKPLTYEGLLEQVNTERLAEMNNIPDQILEVSLSHEYDDLLSHEECQMLMQEKQPAMQITKGQAKEDAEYLWKAFASSYGGYYLFGDENFKAAHQQVLKEIQAYPSADIPFNAFDQMIARAYSFIKDTHIRFRQDALYTTYYVKGIFIREDTKGYYTMLNGQKWYLQAMDKGDLDEYVQITIADTGELVYGLYHRFLSGSDSNMPRTLTVTNGSQVKTIPLRWTQSVSMRSENMANVDRIYATTNMDGHNVIKIMSFGYFWNEKARNYLEAYMETGNTVSGQDYVIVDSRSNGGGSDGCPLVWMQQFLGHKDIDFHSITNDQRLNSSGVDFFVSSRLFEYAQNKLYGRPIQQGVTEYSRERTITKGKQTPNDHPLFILTNNLSGSAGESILKQGRTVENVLAVGTNTYGCMMGSVELQIWLPNSGWYLGFGQCAALEDFVNREGYGYDPDIWTPSEYALELVLKLCDYYGLEDPDAEPLPTTGTVPERVDLAGYTR